MRQAWVLFFGISFGILWGQAESARVAGTVTDPSGANVPGARITLIHESTGVRTGVKSAGDGRYFTLPLRIGWYRVEVVADGFRQAVRQGVVLEIGQTQVLDFRLEVGAASETVQVTAEVPLLSTVDATQGQVINNKRIVDMPLNGRDYIQLALLSGGTTTAVSGSRFGGFSAAGQRVTQNNYMLDGIDNNNVQLSAQGNQAEAVKPSVDAIQEFKISTNSFSAEFGRAAGGVVNATIKSGSNELHGTAYEFLRNEKLDAKNLFDDPLKPKPKFGRNQYGFSVGGPVVRNKLFFFGDSEWGKIRESRTVVNTIPTVLMRQGNFSEQRNVIYDPDTYSAATRTRVAFPGNTIPAQRLDRVAKLATAWYPQPQNGNLLQNYLYNPPNRSDENKWDMKLDANPTLKDVVYFRFSRQDLFQPPSTNLPAPAYGSTDSSFANAGKNTALVWSHTFTPTLVVTSRVGWNQLFTDQQPPTSKNANVELDLRGVDRTTNGAPRFAITGYTALGIGPNLPNLNDSQTRQVISDVNWIRGSHTVKAGGNLSWLQAFITNPKEGLGVFTFNGNFTRNPVNNAGGNGFADFLLGISFQTSAANPVYSNLRAPFYHWYVQDEWRATRRLTLNVGLRYEFNGQWVETRNMMSNYDLDRNPAAPAIVLAKAGSRTDRALIADRKTNFAPRFGLAYQIDKKTVVRSAFGVFIGNYEGTGGGRFMLGNPPNTISIQLSTDSIKPGFLLQDGLPAGSLDPKNLANVRLSSFQVNPKWPKSMQWNFNLQRQLPKEMVFEVGYYASKSTHLPVRWNANYALPGAGNINTRRLYKSIVYPGTSVVVSPLTIVDRHDWFGNSNFHSFQTRFEKRFASGISFLANYTFSKTIGDTGGFSGAGSAPGSPQGFQNPLNRQAEKSVDDQDQRHRFVSSYQYDLPFGRGRRWLAKSNAVSEAILGGWSIGGITTISSGQPFGITVQGDPANTGDTNRPNVVGNPNLAASEQSVGRWFNTAALAANAPFTYGNAGRNILTQPGRSNTDVGLFKAFRITERVGLQFRTEAFNVLNTPPLGTPVTSLGDPAFGRIQSAGRPRNLQFGMKVLF